MKRFSKYLFGFAVIATLFMAVGIYLMLDWYGMCGYPGGAVTLENRPSGKPVELNNLHRLNTLMTLKTPSHELDYNSSYTQLRSTLMFSPEGTYLAAGGAKVWGSGSTCGVVWLINTRALNENRIDFKVLTTPNHSQNADTVFFSPDEKYMVSQNIYNRITLWETASGRQVAVLADKASGTRHSAAFLSNHQVIFAPYQRPVQVWDIPAQGFVELPAISETVERVSVTKGYVALVTGKYSLKLLDIERQQIHTLYTASVGIPVPVFSPDGRWLAAGSEQFRLWEVASQKQIFTFDDGSHPVSSPDSQFVATTQGVWNIDTRQRVLEFDVDSLVSVAFHPRENLVAAATSDGHIQFYDFSSGKMVSEIQAEEVLSKLQGILFSPDGTLFAAAFGRDSLDYGADAGQVTIWGIAEAER